MRTLHFGKGVYTILIIRTGVRCPSSQIRNKISLARSTRASTVHQIFPRLLRFRLIDVQRHSPRAPGEWDKRQFIWLPRLWLCVGCRDEVHRIWLWSLALRQHQHFCVRDVNSVTKTTSTLIPTEMASISSLKNTYTPRTLVFSGLGHVQVLKLVSGTCSVSAVLRLHLAGYCWFFYRATLCLC